MFKFSDDQYYTMPAHFGGMPVSTDVSTTYHDVTSINIMYETDLKMLEQYVPEAFKVSEPVLSISYSRNCRVDWMAGGDYRLISVTVPVVYHPDEENLGGGFSLVVWENKATPCFPGREVTGIPKVFADIEEHHELGEKLFTHASYEGSTFLQMEFLKKEKLGEAQLEFLKKELALYNWFGWRYIPNIGKAGAALNHATLYPQELRFTEVYRGEGRLCWKELTFEQNPTQAHIISALSRLPIISYRECWLTKGSNVLRNDLARQLP